MIPITRQLQIDIITDTPNIIYEWFNEFLWNEICLLKINVFHERGGETIYYKLVNDEKIPIFYYPIFLIPLIHSMVFILFIIVSFL